MSNSGDEAKINFPCAYPIKVMGDAAPDFVDLVADIMLRHDQNFDRDCIETVDSRNGRFVSVRVSIIATGEPQLKALFADLKSTGRVRMVL